MQNITIHFPHDEDQAWIKLEVTEEPFVFYITTEEGELTEERRNGTIYLLGNAPGYAKMAGMVINFLLSQNPEEIRIRLIPGEDLTANSAELLFEFDPSLDDLGSV